MLNRAKHSESGDALTVADVVFDGAKNCPAELLIETDCCLILGHYVEQ